MEEVTKQIASPAKFSLEIFGPVKKLGS